MYDLIIIGAGAGGYAAGIYASRYGLKNLILSIDDGGMSATAHSVENYPGFEAISGKELMEKFSAHAKKYGTEVKIGAKVTKIEKLGDKHFKITSESGEFESKSVILATGNERRKLGTVGEDDFYGKGVSYCVTCDGFFFKDRVVGVVGGGDAALTGALHLAKIAKKVYLIYRGKSTDDMKAERVWVENAIANENIDIILDSNIKEIAGGMFMEKVVLDKEYNGNNEVEMEGVFIEIGAQPKTGWLENMGIETDNKGYVKVDKTGKTNVEGFYAVGDITNASNHFEQIITGAAEAGIAANSIFQELSK